MHRAIKNHTAPGAAPFQTQQGWYTLEHVSAYIIIFLGNKALIWNNDITTHIYYNLYAPASAWSSIFFCTLNSHAMNYRCPFTLCPNFPCHPWGECHWQLGQLEDCLGMFLNSLDTQVRKWVSLHCFHLPNDVFLCIHASISQKWVACQTWRVSVGECWSAWSLHWDRWAYQEKKKISSTHPTSGLIFQLDYFFPLGIE